MTHEPHEPSGDIIKQRAAVLEATLMPRGVMHEIAKTALAETAEVSPNDVADIILPPKKPGEAMEARWQLLEHASDVIKTAATEHDEEIFELAGQLDMRKTESVPPEDVARTDSAKAVFMIEAGANRTSVVRYSVAVETLTAVYGENLEEVTLLDFASDRPVPKERNDKPNPEFGIAQEISGQYLPADEDATEFSVKLATRRQQGYEIEADTSESQNPDLIPGVERVIRMHKAGAPKIELIQPTNTGKGLKDGFAAAHNLGILAEGSQPVVFTNGQYRAKDELQAQQWAEQKGINIVAPVAFGDEAGFTVEHNGKELVTANRGPMVYVNEAVILHRIQR